MTKAYEVQKMTFDAARPYAVVATFRSFNRVIERYSDEASAKRRAYDMNRKRNRRMEMNLNDSKERVIMAVMKMNEANTILIQCMKLDDTMKNAYQSRMIKALSELRSAEVDLQNAHML